LLIAGAELDKDQVMKTQLCSTMLLAAFLAAVPNVAFALDEEDDPEGDSDPGTPDPLPPPPTWEKTWSHSNCFPACGASWGAGYAATGRLTAKAKSATQPNDKLEGAAALDGYARINGSRQSLFRVQVLGISEAKTRTDLTLTAYVGGAAIYQKPFVSWSGTHTFLSGGGNWPSTFFSKTVNLSVGPVPVTFTARATGQLSTTITGKISNVGFEMAGGPSGKASLFASGAVGGKYCVDYIGCVGASAGLSVNVTLVEAGAPTSFALWWSLVNQGLGINLNYALNSKLELKTLAGYLSVFAEACLGACKRWDAELIDWPGWTASYPLIAQSGKTCLAGTCGGMLFGL
jgi:hypothetical protein